MESNTQILEPRVGAQGSHRPRLGGDHPCSRGALVSHMPPSEQGTLYPPQGPVVAPGVRQGTTRFESWLGPSWAGISRRCSLRGPGIAPRTVPAMLDARETPLKHAERGPWGRTAAGPSLAPSLLRSWAHRGGGAGREFSIKKQLIARQQGPFWGPVNLL